MFNSLSLLALAAPLVHAITLTIPQNPRSNEPVTITWTTQAGDPNTFSIELINQQFNNAFAIANNVDVTQQEITLTLPVVPVGGGYTLEAVDIGNINNVFSSTGDFNIGPGSSNAPSNSAASTSAAATSPTATAPVTKPPTLSASGSNAVSTGATNSQIVNTVSGLSSAPSNSASAANSAQSNTSSAAPLSGAAMSSFGANKGVVAAALLSALAGAVVVAL